MVLVPPSPSGPQSGIVKKVLNNLDEFMVGMRSVCDALLCSAFYTTSTVPKVNVEFVNLNCGTVAATVA